MVTSKPIQPSPESASRRSSSRPTARVGQTISFYNQNPSMPYMQRWQFGFQYELPTGMVAEAQQKKASILEELGRERGLLERKIDELRGFERDYRSRLHDYIAGQLEDLKNVAVDKEEAPAEQAAEPQPEHQG